MDLETINKMKEWEEKEIPVKNKYPKWFLKCQHERCKFLKGQLGIKENDSDN